MYLQNQDGLDVPYGTIAGPSNQRQGAQTLFWFHKVQWNLKTNNVEIPGVDLDPKLV